MVICIGRNGDDIVWSHVFSWGLSEILDVEIKNRILDLYVYSDSMIKNNTVVPIIGDLKNPITENSDIPVLPISNVSESNSVVKIKSNQPKLTNNTLIELYEYLNDNLHRFERRSFKEFDYLSVELSNFQIIIIYIISIIVTILTNLWIINNSIYEGK